MMITIKAKCVITPHYFNVRVFDTQKEMYAYYLAYIKVREDKECEEGFKGFSRKLDFDGICMPYERMEHNGRRMVHAKRDIGEVLLYRKNMGAGMVAHELGHAAFWWSRYVKKNKEGYFGTNAKNPREEMMLTCLYHLVRTFVNSCYKKGIYK